MSLSPEKISGLVDPCVKVIGLQLTLASKTPEDAMGDMWSLGYCFGAFDAMGRRANLDQYTDGFAIITIGFVKLTGRAKGPDHLSRALDHQTDQLFYEGNYAGGSDMFDWATKDGFAPLMLMNYFTFGRPRFDPSNA